MSSRRNTLSMLDRKPSRLRAACNECHAAKLRCSGERTGCRRCLATGLKCEYKVSMVGRATAKNKRRRLVPPTGSSPVASNSPEQSQRSRSDDVHLSQSESTGENDSDARPQPPTPGFSLDEGTLIWPGQTLGVPLGSARDDCNCETIFSKSGPHHEPNGHLPDLASMDLPMDFDLTMSMDDLPDLHEFANLSDTPAKEPLTHSPAVNTDRCPIAMIDPPPERPNCTDPNHDKYRHVMHMFRVVASLEQTTEKENLSLDEILQLNKASIRTITMIFELENRNFCKTCKALAPTALNLVMDLYERAVTTCCGTAPAESTIPAAVLQLGSFELEPADQGLVRDLVVARELQRTIQTVQSLCAHSRCERGGANCGTLRWYADMEQRLKALMPAVHPADDW